MTDWTLLWTAVGAIGSAVASIAAAVALVLLVRQLGEAKQATYAQTFLAASERLQDESARSDRRATFLLEGKPYGEWTDAEKETAQRVVQLLDLTAVMVHEGMLPKTVVVENWGDTYRRTWNCARELVRFARERANDPTFFLRFEWLAGEARKIYTPLNDGTRATGHAGTGELELYPTYALDKATEGERAVVPGAASEPPLRSRGNPA